MLLSDIAQVHKNNSVSVNIDTHSSVIKSGQQ